LSAVAPYTKSETAFVLIVLKKATTKSMLTRKWTATKYEYEGQKRRIIPITISQLITLIDTVKIVQQQGKKFTHSMLQEFYDTVSTADKIPNSISWLENIKITLKTWQQKYCA